MPTSGRRGGYFGGRKGETPMKKIVLTFGLISGGIVSALMTMSIFLIRRGSFEHSEIVGYSTMILAFLLVFFGIRSYRDNVAGGAVTFGKAFQVGILMTLITCTMYVVSWEIVYFNFMPDFMDHYTASVLRKMHENGATTAAIAAKSAEMAKFKEMYKNPLFNVGMTFMEIFPVGLIMTLISAGILRRKRGTAATLLAETVA
jgi:hypothetical protein